MKKGKKSSSAKALGGKKKIKKIAGKKKVMVKKIKKRKFVGKKKTGKAEGLFGSKTPENRADMGVKILVKEELGEQISQPISEPIEEAPMPAAPETGEIPQVVLVEEISQENENYETNDPDLAMDLVSEEIEPETNSDYIVEEIQEIETAGYLSDRHKSIIMYVAIASIMVVIVIFWGLSIKYSLSQNMQNARLNNGEESEDVRQIKESLNNLKDDFSLMSDYAREQLDQALNIPTQGREQIIEDRIKDEVTAELQQKINNLNVSASDGNILE